MFSDLFLALLITGNAMLMIDGEPTARIVRGVYVFFITSCLIHIRTMNREIVKNFRSIGETLDRLKRDEEK